MLYTVARYKLLCRKRSNKRDRTINSCSNEGDGRHGKRGYEKRKYNMGCNKMEGKVEKEGTWKGIRKVAQILPQILGSAPETTLTINQFCVDNL